METKVIKIVCIGLFLITVCSGQQDKKSWIDFLKPESMRCYSEIRQVQFDCFKNEDLNLTFVEEYLIGRLKTSHINTSPEDFVLDLCSKRARVIECIVPKVLNKRGNGACVDGSFFNMAIQEMTQRLTMYNNACNASLFFATPKEQCTRTISFDTYNCYAQSGLLKQMFISNGSLEGATIGTDKESAQKYCNSRFNLFNCMRGIFVKCPVAKEYYLLNGFDYDSMEESIHLLCDDKDLYLKGLECFQEPHKEVVSCVNELTSAVLDLSVQQFLDDASHEKYFKEFCKIRSRHVDCDVKAWSTKCQADSIGLKNQFQCKQLPKRCQTDKELKIHESVCHTDNFNLHLRNTGTKIIQSYFIIAFVTVSSFMNHLI